MGRGFNTPKRAFPGKHNFFIFFFPLPFHRKATLTPLTQWGKLPQGHLPNGTWLPKAGARHRPGGASLAPCQKHKCPTSLVPAQFLITCLQSTKHSLGTDMLPKFRENARLSNLSSSKEKKNTQKQQKPPVVSVCSELQAAIGIIFSNISTYVGVRSVPPALLPTQGWYGRESQASSKS